MADDSVQEEALDIACCLRNRYLLENPWAQVLLKEADEARLERRWDSAEDIYATILNSVEADDTLDGNTDSCKGLAYMYLGVAAHAQEHLAQAVHYYRQAKYCFGLDSHNMAVAAFALAVAQTRADGYARLHSIGTTAWRVLVLSDAQQTVQERWKITEDQVQDRRTKATHPENGITIPEGGEPMEAELPTNPETDSIPSPQLRPDDWGLSKLKQASELQRALEITPPFLALAILGILLYVLVAPVTAVVFAMVAAVCMAAMFVYLHISIPQNQAGVFERGGLTTVEWGPQHLFRFPLFEKLKAIVPLGPQYALSRYRLATEPPQGIDIILKVCYGVDTRPEDDKQKSDNVVKAIAWFDGFSVSKRTSNGEKPEPSKCHGPEDLRSFWEQQLRSEMELPVESALQDLTYEQLMKPQSNAPKSIGDRIKHDLQQRVREHGLRVSEVCITGVTRNPSLG